MLASLCVRVARLPQRPKDLKNHLRHWVDALAAESDRCFPGIPVEKEKSERCFQGIASHELSLVWKRCEHCNCLVDLMV